MKTINVLILEDDLLTLSALMRGLAELESDSFDIGVTVLSNYKDVEDHINQAAPSKYDIILLDRDCKLAGSFHVLDLERFGAQKVVSISSVPDYNVQAQERGVEHVVWKDYTNLDGFTNDVMSRVKILIGSLGD
jgi:DNA-binding NarL/FixJ family response regulator